MDKEVEEYVLSRKEKIMKKIDFDNLIDGNAVFKGECDECSAQIVDCSACHGDFVDGDSIWCDEDNEKHLHDECKELLSDDE